MTSYQPYQGSPGSTAMVPGPPPILLSVAPPAPQSRLTVLVRLILAIPHLFLIAVLGIAAEVVVFIGWWGALFTARLPQFAVDYLSGYMRWATRVYAYLYLLTDVYPPFSFSDAPEYPVSVAFPAPQRLNRAAVFFRWILLIPVGFLASFLVYGAGTLLLFIAWLVALFGGRLPDSFHLAYTAVLRWQVRYYGYALMLTPAYPGALYGDQPDTVTWADGAQADQAPGFGTPGSVYGTPGSPYGTPGSGYDAPGWGQQAPGGYGAPGQQAPGGYGTPGYGAPGYGAPGYGTPGYGAPGYGTPGGYDAPGYAPGGGYAAGAGYQAQPGRWLILLTSGAKGLITVFIVLGVLLDFGVGAVRAFTGAASINKVNTINQLNSDYTTLSNSLTSWQTATQACNGNLTCVTTLDAKAATYFDTFSGQLASTSVPSGANAAKAKVAADAAAATQDFTQLSKVTSASQYESTVTSSGLETTLNNFDADFNALTQSVSSS